MLYIYMPYALYANNLQILFCLTMIPLRGCSMIAKEGLPSSTMLISLLQVCGACAVQRPSLNALFFSSVARHAPVSNCVRGSKPNSSSNNM